MIPDCSDEFERISAWVRARCRVSGGLRAPSLALHRRDFGETLDDLVLRPLQFRRSGFSPDIYADR